VRSCEDDLQKRDFLTHSQPRKKHVRLLANRAFCLPTGQKLADSLKILAGIIIVVSAAGRNLTMPTPRDFQAILDDLVAHGFNPDDWFKIKKMVSWPYPQARVIFMQRFGRRRPIASVLTEIDRWKYFLGKESLLTTEDKRSVEQLVRDAELLAWQALLEMNLPKIGPWTICQTLLRTEKDEKGRPRYGHPRKVTAVHETTGERREALIPAEECNDPRRYPDGGWRHAFETLGIWELVETGLVHKGVLTERPEPKSSPVFTQRIIPALYESLLPLYAKQGHHFTTRDSTEDRQALFPNELLQIVLDILRLEYPDIFAHATTASLKGAIQRHIDRKASPSTNSPQ
jgi:hypothetical protein